MPVAFTETDPRPQQTVPRDLVPRATDPRESGLHMEIGEIPHLADFTFHKTLEDVDFEGVPVKGLVADFHRRPVGDRVLSVGVYRFAGSETHRAWGWVGEAHCSWHAYRDPGSGGFDGPFAGCPLLRVLFDGDRARGFELGSGSPARRFLVDPEDGVVAGAVTARPVP
nr:hypothetical protein GCM10025732_22570 [Glycomyces mayteni]